MEENLLTQTQAVDFSLIALFFRATITVKLVMLVLYLEMSMRMSC